MLVNNEMGELSVGFYTGLHWVIKEPFVGRVTHWAPIITPPHPAKNEQAE